VIQHTRRRFQNYKLDGSLVVFAKYYTSDWIKDTMGGTDKHWVYTWSEYVKGISGLSGYTWKDTIQMGTEQVTRGNVNRIHLAQARVRGKLLWPRK
jgi:hypothetical protein